MIYYNYNYGILLILRIKSVFLKICFIAKSNIKIKIAETYWRRVDTRQCFGIRH